MERPRFVATDTNILINFLAVSQRVGAGESAAIAVAVARNWSVATDEKGRTRREIVARLGDARLLTTPGILVRCLVNGALTVTEADAIKLQLESRRFIMPFRSFSERVPGES